MVARYNFSKFRYQELDEILNLVKVSPTKSYRIAKETLPARITNQSEQDAHDMMQILKRHPEFASSIQIFGSEDKQGWSIGFNLKPDQLQHVKNAGGIVESGTRVLSEDVQQISQQQAADLKTDLKDVLSAVKDLPQGKQYIHSFTTLLRRLNKLQRTGAGEVCNSEVTEVLDAVKGKFPDEKRLAGKIQNILSDMKETEKAPVSRFL